MADALAPLTKDGRRFAIEVTNVGVAITNYSPAHPETLFEGWTDTFRVQEKTTAGAVKKALKAAKLQPYEKA